MTERSGSSRKLLKHSTIYAIGNISRQLVGFLMLPIYTQFLSPADYGVVGLLTFAVAMMEPFFGARLGEAMPKYYFEATNDSDRHSVISTALAITAGVSSITSFCIFIFDRNASTALFGSPHYKDLVGLFGTLVLTQAVDYYGMTYIRLLQKPLLFIGVSLSKLIIQLTLNIVLVVKLKLGVTGVVISGVSASTLYALGLTIFMLSQTGLRFNRATAVSMIRFSWPLWFVGLSSLFIFSSNRYFIRLYSSLEHVGLYELSVKFATILTFIAWQPFNQYWETERFSISKQTDAKSVFSIAFKIVSLWLTAVAFAIGVASEPIIRMMAAPSFYQAYAAVPWVTIAFMLSCWTSFLCFSFLLTNRTRTISVISNATAIFVTAANFMLIPTFGFAGAAIALMLAMLFQFVVLLLAGRKAYDMGIKLGHSMTLLAVLVVGFLMSTFVVYSKDLMFDIASKMLLLLVGFGSLATLAWLDADIRPKVITAIDAGRRAIKKTTI